MDDQHWWSRKNPWAVWCGVSSDVTARSSAQTRDGSCQWHGTALNADEERGEWERTGLLDGAHVHGEGAVARRMSWNPALAGERSALGGRPSRCAEFCTDKRLMLTMCCGVPCWREIVALVRATVSLRRLRRLNWRWT